MSIERKGEVLFLDSTPVVFHHQAVKSTPFHGDDNGGRPCIQTVFDQFLDDLCGPLHDLSSSDETDRRFVQLADFLRFHERPSTSFFSA